MASQAQPSLSSAAEAYLQAVSAGRRAKAPVRVRLEAAAALYKASRFEAAELVYRAVLKKRPNSYRALLNLGYLARRRGDQAAALEYFEAARAAQPQKSRPKLEAARDLRKMSRLDEAEALYRSVLRHQPTQARALVNLGRIATARGNVKLALNFYQTAFAANPGRDLKLKIASQLRKLSPMNEARQADEGILAENPDDFFGARARLRKLAKSGLAAFRKILARARYRWTSFT